MYTFKIEGLNCLGCFQKIESSLKGYDSQIFAKPDVQNKTVSIETKHTMEIIKNLIEDAGYVAKNITTG